jgi:hypothetical protein
LEADKGALLALQLPCWVELGIKTHLCDHLSPQMEAGTRLQWPQFLHALEAIAAKKAVGLDTVIYKVNERACACNLSVSTASPAGALVCTHLTFTAVSPGIHFTAVCACSWWVMAHPLLPCKVAREVTGPTG